MQAASQESNNTGNTQGAAPSNMTAGAAPSNMTAGAAPSNMTAGAAPSNMTAGAAPSNMTAGAAPSNMTAGAAPSNMTAGAAPSNMTAGAAPSNMTAGAAPNTENTQESNNTGSAAQGASNENTGDFVNTILGIHNRERAAVGVPPLVWSDELATGAKSWADHVATINQMVHSTGDQRPGQGENIAGWTHGCGLSFSGPLGTQPNFPLDYTKGVCPGDTLRTMVESWVNEKTNWHGGVLTQENWYPTGHYTQVVWRDTKQVGCGIATGSNTDYLVCRYSPGGNVIGHAPY